MFDPSLGPRELGLYLHSKHTPMSVLHRSNIRLSLLPHLFFAGRACLTFFNRQTGSHMTVHSRQVRDREDQSKKLPIFYIYVSLLNDGDHGKKFAATFFQTTMTYKLGRDVQPNSQLAKVMQFLQHSLKNPKLVSDLGAEVMHEGKCCRCNRPLTHPESIGLGFGPECWEIMKSSCPELENEDFFVDVKVSEPQLEEVS